MWKNTLLFLGVMGDLAMFFLGIANVIPREVALILGFIFSIMFLVGLFYLVKDLYKTNKDDLKKYLTKRNIIIAVVVIATGIIAFALFPDRKETEATLYDLFLNDNIVHINQGGNTMGGKNIINEKGQFTVKACVILGLNEKTNNKFASFYIPHYPATESLTEDILKKWREMITLKQDKVSITNINTGEKGNIIDHTGLNFSGRIFIYHESPMTYNKKLELINKFKKQDNLAIEFRGQEYLSKIKKQKPRISVTTRCYCIPDFILSDDEPCPT